MKRISCLLLLLFCSIILFAKPEYAGYPFAGLSNDTGFYSGILGYIRYRPAHFDSTIAKNVFYFSTAYSEKKQFNFLFKPAVRFKNGLYELKTELEYKKWPSKFYGIGMGTDRDEFEKFTSQERKLFFNFTRNLTDKWDISLDYEYLDYHLTKTEENRLLENGKFVNPNNEMSSGLGFSIDFDTRNSESFPSLGGLYSIQFIEFSHHLGSDHGFSRTRLDLRKFLQISEQHTLAFQSYFSTIQGDAPFYQLNYLNDNMRAITSNLYIDRNAYIFRMEDRFFHWNSGFEQRFGLVFFAELGEVIPEISKFNIAQTQFNYGLGFRYSFFLEDRMNARIDIGFGEVKASISIATGEVF
ncbi:MAG: BamA/TamA family outer membrane protein [Candidatus Cloacimonadales bacterium]|nr:BamA/TamA family outer membrane protein [Candidatus Cloacimonadales bacterium]